jgi:NADPH:quinone reductase-like Zn-dependent oxidoreductase
MLRSIGADRVIDYTREDFTKSGETYDVIFDVGGKNPFSGSIRALTQNGLYLPGNPSLSQRIRAGWASTSSGKKIVPYAARAANEFIEGMHFLKGQIEAGKIRSVLERRYPLEQIAEAHRYVDSGHKREMSS